jgi:hypothetical protein
MGAALTYAQRYALFTLVGIAGEEDVDAPDLQSPIASETKTDPAAGNKKDRINGAQGQSAQQLSKRRTAKASASPPKAMLAPKELAELRDRLVAELNKLDSAEQAANWAQRGFGAKYRLMAGDAEHVEQAFKSKLAIFVGKLGNGMHSPHGDPPRPNLQKR